MEMCVFFNKKCQKDINEKIGNLGANVLKTMSVNFIESKPNE